MKSRNDEIDETQKDTCDRFCSCVDSSSLAFPSHLGFAERKWLLQDDEENGDCLQAEAVFILVVIRELYMRG